jgi:molybdate transport system ATP-binding protein
VTIDAHFQLAREHFTLDATFSVPARGITALFGPSGCGKTTLLRAIAGLEKDARGHFRIGDTVWQDATQRLPTHQRAVGYVFQEASLFAHLSVQQNLEYGFKRIAAEQRQIPFEQAVDLLGLAPLLQRHSSQLSGGERQRVAIARALLTSPQLLLMDEPLAALDHQRKQEILPFFERLHAELKIPMIYVSHAPDEVARLADYLVLLENGRVQASGPIAEMLTRADLPLAHDHDAGAIIDATVTALDTDYHLATVSFPGGDISIAEQNLAVGEKVRLRILARDVSLTLKHQTDTSILNIIPVTVTALSEENSLQNTSQHTSQNTLHNKTQLLVQLDAAGTTLLARVTRKSADALKLAPGKLVFAQVKSVALLG